VETLPGSTRRHYVMVSIVLFVVSALLTAGMTCDEGYQLTISSTGGGSVTVPGEGTRNYNAGTVVELVATPDEGYDFRQWTGDTVQIADPNSASTTITMNGDYSIGASFDMEASTPGHGEGEPPLGP